MPNATPALSTTIFFYVKVAGEKFPGQTVVNGDTVDEYRERMGAFFEELAAKFDEAGEPADVTFEPRELGAPRPAGPGKPLPEAPQDVPQCPIHKVALKEKTNRSTGAKFYSCGERNGQGGYCNWKPADQK